MEVILRRCPFYEQSGEDSRFKLELVPLQEQQSPLPAMRTGSERQKPTIPTIWH